MHHKKDALRAMGPRLLYLAGATLLLIAGTFVAWQAWQINGAQRAGVKAMQVRDQQAAALGQLLQETQERAEQALADESVLQVLGTAADADRAAAVQAVKKQWPELLDAEFYSPEIIEVMRADLTKFGYARAAMLVQAHSLQKAAPAQAQIDAKGSPSSLVLALPVQREHHTIAYAYLRLPVAPLLHLFRQQAAVAGAQIDLRQGSIGADHVIERLGDGMDNSPGLSVPVSSSLFRVAVLQPEQFIVLPREPGLLFGAAMFMLLLAGALLWLRQVGMQRLIEILQRQPLPSEQPTMAQSLRDQAGAPASAAAPQAVATRRSAPSKNVTPTLLDPTIFRAYDIRGVLGKTLDAAVARSIGHAIGSEARARDLREIVVGRDGRLSGPELSAALIEGLRASGCNVIDIGAVPTPVLYFGTYHLEAGSGVMVTGSHNPPDYNGFKIVLGGETLAEGAIRALYTRISEGDLSRGEGTLQSMDITRDYIERITGDVQVQHPLKVVVDCGNGIPGAVAPAVLAGIGCEIVPLYCDVDGTFPNHHPDPSDPHNLQDLILTVQQTGADIGLAFDGDGDRLGVVTRSGEIIYPDRVLMLFAIDVLSRNPGATIIYDVKCTGHLQPLILQHAGSPVMWRTGHSLIKAKMRETQAELAGEMSGHFFFRERWYGFDDGIYAAARLLEILAGDLEERTAQAIFDSLPQGVSTPELKLDMAEGENSRFIQRFQQSAHFDGARVTHIDGVRADWSDGWGLVRASNTTPILVLRFDADNAAALERIKNIFREQLLALDASLNLPF